MLNLRHVLKFIVDRFYYGAFSEQHLVGDTHQRVLHFVFKLGYQLYTIYEELAKQVFTDIASVTNQFAVEFFGEAFHLQRLSIVHVSWCEHDIVTREPNEHTDHLLMHGAQIIINENLTLNCAIIDRSVVWYGNVPLLGYHSPNDNIITLHNPELAATLLNTLLR